MKSGAEEFYAKAKNSLEVVNKDEVIAWLKHPITVAMINTLEGDYMGFFEDWGNGMFTGENADETAQKNAKALGQVQAIESMVAWIEAPLENAK